MRIESIDHASPHLQKIKGLGAANSGTLGFLPEGQDRTTIPMLSISPVNIVEGNAGTTTVASFTVTLSAATGRAVTGNYVTSNITAFGGTTCGNPRVRCLSGRTRG